MKIFLVRFGQILSIPVDGIDNDGNGYIDDIHGWDFENDDNTTFDSKKDDHGTHVSGTIGAIGGNSIGVARSLLAGKYYHGKVSWTFRRFNYKPQYWL